jgi:mRNA-degrading endonuclease RelE of RelBE toxin-antitoxin system
MDARIDLWGVRVGPYRIVYRIDDSTRVVVIANHRDDVYEER